MDHIRLRFIMIHALSPTPAGRIAVLLGRLFKIPVLVHLHAAEAVYYPEFSHGDLLNPKLKKITQKVCEKADVLTVLSEFQKRVVSQNLQLNKDIVVIPRGLDIKSFPFSHKEVGERLRILFIGYPEPVKDPAGALEVFARINRKMDATLTMVGIDLSFQLFHEQLIKAGIVDKVVFCGALPYEAVKKIYQAADVLLVTSRYESQSAVAMEAMASGVLVCGTNVGVLADLAGEACLTVAPEDYEGLAEQVIKLWKEPERQMKLRTQARHWSEAHDSKWTAKQYENLMKTLINKNK
jgi:glycosyltransferase involved in cell wall biosynthesis